MSNSNNNSQRGVLYIPTMEAGKQSEADGLRLVVP